MYLHKEELKKMLQVLEQFPEVETVEVKQDNSSGIGSHITMMFRTTINNVSGEFAVTVSSVENW
jgi:hypothetical protein